MTPRALAPQRQSLFGVQPVEPVLAHVPALPSEHDEEPPIPKSDARLRQLAHPLSEDGQRITLALIPKARAMEARDHRRAPLAHLVAAHQVRHDLTLPDGL